MQYQPLPYTIVAADVAGSGAFNDRFQLSMRATLQTTFAEVLARQSMDRNAVDVNDLGDGLRLIVDARVSPRLLLDPFIPNLAGALREHRGISTGATGAVGAAGAAGLRLRVAVHMGLLHRDATGWAGEPLVHCARLLDAAPVRRVLVEADRADLVLVVSQAVYDAVVRHGYGLDQATYRPVNIVAKETTTTAWVHVPGYLTPPDPGDSGASLGRPNGRRQPAPMAQLIGVVDALLDIPSFAVPQSREEVLGLLRHEVATAIPRHSSARVEAVSIVRTCMRYPDGLHDLVEAVRIFAGGSSAMARLDQMVAGLK